MAKLEEPKQVKKLPTVKRAKKIDFSKMNPKQIQEMAETISMMVRAFEGRPIESEDIITRLINVKDTLERGRYPTYGLIRKQVFLRLVAKFHPELKSWEEWADIEAKAMIQYKGLGHEEYVKMQGAGAMQPEQMFYLNPQIQQQQQQEKKRRFWQRRPKEPQTEFISK